ncbi:hypothetical protein Chor_009948 [Crotalus horridus]
MAVEAALAAVGGRDGAEQVLSRFNEQNRSTFKFESSDEEKRKQLCEGILQLLSKDINTSYRVTCLEALRILSRDKKVLVPVTTKTNMQTLMKLAKLDTLEDHLEDVTDFPVIVEALKCLCNIVFNSPAAQKLSLELNLAAMLCNLLRKCKDQQFVEDIKCFDLRLLFLLSLLHTDIRSQLRNDLQGLPLLTQALESAFSITWTDKYTTAEDQEMSQLSLQETDCAIEALKALFNVTLDSWNVHSELQNAHNCNAINLLSNVPVSCLDVLISPSAQEEAKETDVKYNGMNMDAIQVLLKFMEKRIDKGSSYREGLTPVLSLLTRCCRSHRNIRKFIKAQVLPPLRDVSNRPEVGTTLRNKLVRLMTHVDLGVKQIAAEFLFVLFDSLLKYTGYGNAAGLLAARGLLAGGRGENCINLITGHLEEPMPNPMDEMTEEQKEYEAMKLVNMFDKLSRDKVITPMGVRPDGTMTPLEEIVCQHQANEHETSDSD